MGGVGVFNNICVGISHPTAPQHVVHQDDALRAEAAQDLVVVGLVRPLVGVDKGQIDGRVIRQRGQCLGRGGDHHLDPVGHPGPVPVRPPDTHPLVAHVAAQQTPARGQPSGDGQGREAGKGAHLHGKAHVEQAGKHGHEGGLLGGNLHPGNATQLGSDVDQLLGDGVDARAVGHQIFLHIGAEADALGVLPVGSGTDAPRQRTGRDRR